MLKTGLTNRCILQGAPTLNAKEGEEVFHGCRGNTDEWKKCPPKKSYGFKLL